MAKKAVEHRTCAECGNEFEAWRALGARFCSRLCYKRNRQLSGGVKCCSSCGETKALSEYSPAPRAPFGVNSHCRECKRADCNKRNRAQRVAVIEAYGGRCACCGEGTYEFLALDHINGGGGQHRRQVTSQSLYRLLIREGFPKGEYQILCHNCNMAKGFYGQCPHQRGRGEAEARRAA